MTRKFFTALMFAVSLVTLVAGYASGASVMNADVVFFIDSSGSMGDDIEGVRTNLAAFSEAMVSSGINVRFAVINYESGYSYGGITVHKPDGTNIWTSDTSLVESVLSNIRASGGDGNSLAAINEIFSWKDFRNDAQRFGFILTDVVHKVSYNSESEYVTEESTIQKLLEMNMHMSVITNQYYEEEYSNIYTQTGGEFIDIDEGDYYQKMLGIANYVDSIVQSIDAQPDVPITKASFPDESFLNYLKDNFDENGDGILSSMERSVSSLNLKGKGISDLTGIELFYLLTYLDCSYNDLKTLDVSKNTRLRTLYCNNNHLTALDLSRNASLVKVDASNQFARAGEAAPSGNSSLPYQFDLNRINTSLGANVDIEDFMSKVYSLDVVNQDGNSVNFSVDTASKKWYFADKDVLVTYSYKTLSADSNDENSSGNTAVTVDASSMTTRPAIYDTLSEDYYRLNRIRSRLSVSSDTALLDNTTLTVGTALSQEEAATTLQGLVTSKISVDIIFPSVKSDADGIAVFALSSDQIAQYRGKRVSLWMVSRDIDAPDYSSGVFLDASGDITYYSYSSYNKSIIPTTGDVYVAAFMKAGTEYNPIIAELTYSPYATGGDTTADNNKDFEVTLAFGNVVVPPTAELSPASQTIQTGGDINPISLIVLNTLTSQYTAAVRELPTGLTFANNTVTGSISSLGTYTVSLDVTDSVSHASSTASATITVVDNTPTNPNVYPIYPNTPTVPRNNDADAYRDPPVITPDQSASPVVSEDISPVSADTTQPTSGDTNAPISGDSSPNTQPDGNIDPYANGGGRSRNSALSLSTAEALFSMMDRVNRGVETQGLYYKIDSDIDLSSISDWAGIGNDSHPFTGHMDGNGHTITYVNSSTALFGTVNSEGTAIQNLHVSARTAAASSSFMASASPASTNGGIVQKLLGGTIEACSFSGNVEADGDDSSAGGIAGEVSGGTIKNCEVHRGSDVNAGYSAGGIAGYISGGEIIDCTSNAQTNAEFSGGIAGYSETERDDINGNSFTQSDYEIGNDAVSLQLSPSTQNVTDGSPITSITPTSGNFTDLSFVVEGGYDLGLTVSGGAISGTIPDNTSAGSYTVTITGVDSDGIRLSGQVQISVTKRPGRIYPSRGNNLLDYIFDMPAALSNGISSFFGGENVYQFAAEEIASETWQPETADLRAILGTNMQAVMILPAVRPARSGVYVLKLTLADLTSGVNIGLQGITSAGDISASDLEDMEYAFFDEMGREITTVPTNKTVYAALRLNSGRTHRGLITAPKELALGTIVPIELDDTLRNNIATTMNISPDALRSITDDEIYDPQEPSEAAREKLTSRDRELVGKMNTLVVSRDGYYVLKVILSDDLYEQHIKGVKLEDLKAYAVYDKAAAGSGEVIASLPLLGALNTLEIFGLTGQKPEFGLKEFLMVGFLNAGTPFSVYLTKLLIALLMGGCDVGLGIAGLGVVAVAVILLMRRRR